MEWLTDWHTDIYNDSLNVSLRILYNYPQVKIYQITVDNKLLFYKKLKIIKEIKN